MSTPTFRPGQTIRLTHFVDGGTKITHEGTVTLPGAYPYLPGFGYLTVPMGGYTIEVLSEPEPTELGTVVEFDYTGRTVRAFLSKANDGRIAWIDADGVWNSWGFLSSHNVRIISIPSKKEG